MAKNKKHTAGFTLSEVLITLTIIGIVAALTIPSLINNVSDSGLNAALKKDFASLSQATQTIISENNGTFKGILGSGNLSLNFMNAYKNYLNVAKTCTDARNEGCWHPLNSNGGTWKTLNGNDTDTLASGSGLILNNGSLVNFIGFQPDCSYQGAYYTKPTTCGWVVVDVNGFKKPNIIGKDVFYFNVLANKIEPWGVPDSVDITCSNAGLYCAASKLLQ